ncbi:MAG: metallophosphoesterase [Deltaproteobacteria bacterium]|nr:metallophosphoesterase [Deltaproteobacteria bacterium]
MEGLLFTFIGRPAITWQMLGIFALPPLAALFVLVKGSGFISWILFGRKRSPEKVRSLDEGRRLFLRRAGAVGLAAASSLCGCGVLLQSAPPGVSRKDVFLPNLPSELDGFVICQLTDLHLGLWSTPLEVEMAFRKAAQEKPDLVFLTGDLVDRNPDNARSYYEPLRLLKDVPHGVYAVLGNHDHYAGPKRIVELLDGYGLTMLVDESLNLPKAPVTIFGLDDQSSGSWMGSYKRRERAGLDTDPDVLKFSKVTGPSRRPGDVAILLNHRPEGYRQASREGFDLYLAGHTHGGQYQMPFLPQENLAAYFYRYSSGLYHEHRGWLNVSRGLSSVGIPFRLFAWPEIDVLTLRKAVS